MQQADPVHILKPVASPPGKIGETIGTAEILPFPHRRAYPYGRAPRFDPSNPEHIEAWQNMWEYGQIARKGQS